MSRFRPISIVIFALFALCAWAQNDATLVGTVTDQSGAVQPNASIEATETASGGKYTGTTDERGTYRIANMQPGTYRVQVTQTGFAPAAANVELLVGQTVTLAFALRVESLQQTVAVTAEAPLVNTETQDVGGNIDRRQMDGLPLLGRNWLDLSMLVKGVTANDVAGNRPGVQRDDQFQLNLDGQQITQDLSTSSGFGQMRISRDAIAEYQLVNSQFDISQGRSLGTQVQAVTRSGANDIHGTFYGNFRRDALNAADFVARKVLPYSDTQLGATFGGPIIKDKLQYFAAYEHESEPNTVFVSPQAYQVAGQPIVGLSFPNTNTQYSLLARGDYEPSASDHISVRGTFWNFTNPFTNLSSASYPAAAQAAHRYADSVVGNWSHVFTSNLVLKVNAGWFKYFFKYTFAAGIAATPRYIFPGLTVGPGFNYPENFYQRHPQVTPELSWHHLQHDFKVGADILERQDGGYWPLNGRGSVSFATLPPDAAARFPLSDWNDSAAWNFTGLTSSITTVTQSFYQNPNIYTPRPTYGVWVGDTWHVLRKLTLTLGIRWDADLGQYNPPNIHATNVTVTNGFDPPNFQVGYLPNVRTTNDWAPRFGVSWATPHNWVFRGGIGMYYSFNETQLALGPEVGNAQTALSSTFVNNGRPDFLTNWTGGFTAQQFLNGTAPLPPQAYTTYAPDMDDPRVLQATGGFQKQIGNSWSFDSDFVFFKGSHLAWSRDINSFYDPASGYPVNANPPKGPVNPAGASNIRPNPNFQGITYFESNLISEYMAVASSITKRFSSRWQAGITNTIMIKNNDEGSGGLPTQGFSEIANINNYYCPSCSWGRSPSFQRDTFRFNGVYQGPWGLNFSGIIYIGTGTYWNDSFVAPAGKYALQAGQFGDNLLVNSPTAAAGSVAATIPTNVQSRFSGPAQILYGSQLPRDGLKGLPLYKTDFRLSKDFKFRERLVFTAMAEGFNLFNHPNYGSYQTVVNLPGFGNPVQNTSISYVPREFQFAFHVSF
ncbi:MAG TPA: carboxypeptidase regulatory-like domain-containing protein [Bryobacteraceae bacterium]